MTTGIRILIARALVRAAIAAAPADMAGKLREITRPIWRPE